MFSWINGRTLPRPSGPFSVGFFDFEWSPPKSGHTPEPPAFSLARVYYPSSPVATLDAGFEERCGKWIPSSDYLPSYGYYMKIPRLISASAFRLLAGHLKLRAAEHVPVLVPKQPFPVIVFSHGLAGIRTTYSTICTDLASHGFIVAAIEHRLLWRFLGSLQRALHRLFSFTSWFPKLPRDGSASMTIEQQTVKSYDHPEDGLGETELHQFRGKQLVLRSQEVSATLDLLESIKVGDPPANLWRLPHPEHTSDLQQVLNSLKGRLEFGKTVVMGHSFGAATGFFSASRDPRVRSVVAMDPWMYPLPGQFAHKTQYPLLVINSETFHWKTNLDSLKQLLHHNLQLGTGHASMMVSLKGTGHMDQSDFTVALPPYVTDRFRPGQTSDPVAVLRSNNDIVLAFLKQKAKIDLPSGAETLELPNSEEDRAQFESNQSCIVDYM